MSRNRCEQWRWTGLWSASLLSVYPYLYELKCCPYIDKLAIASAAVSRRQYQQVGNQGKVLILQQQRRLSRRLGSHKQKVNRQRHIQHHLWKRRQRQRRRRRAAVLSLAAKQTKQAASAPWVLRLRCCCCAIAATVISDSQRGFGTLNQGSLEESVGRGEWRPPVEDGDGGADEGEASGWAAHWTVWLAKGLGRRD